MQGSCNCTYLRPTMAPSFGPQFQYERPPPEPLLLLATPWLKWLLMVFTKDPKVGWPKTVRPTVRPSWPCMEDARREQEGRKEGRKIITARAHFGEINRVLITRPSRQRPAGQGVQAPHGRGRKGLLGRDQVRRKEKSEGREAALLPSIWDNGMMAILN